MKSRLQVPNPPDPVVIEQPPVPLLQGYELLDMPERETTPVNLEELPFAPKEGRYEIDYKLAEELI